MNQIESFKPEAYVSVSAIAALLSQSDQHPKEMLDGVLVIWFQKDITQESKGQ